ncbi:YceI family protein [Nonomuraea terrae]|uniref:YceI family protein n=1 Tax=Nonomuraea terrae TaxID=2530383 RepID=UPI0037A6389F
MSISAGRYALGPDTGRLVVLTTRTGLGAKAGHDLTIEATRWHGVAMVDPADPAGSSVTVEVEAGSLAVREGTGGVKPLSDSDRRDIEKAMREKVLQVGRHPAITFRSRGIGGTPESFRIEGDLELAGATRPLVVEGTLDAAHARGSAVIVQSQWGIKPYSAFFGALKLNDEVEIRFEADLTPEG